MISEFQIPSKHLYDANTSNNKDDNVILSEISTKIEEFYNCLENEGACYILKNFDDIFCILQNISQMNKNDQTKLWNFIIKSCKQLFQELSSYLDGDMNYDLQSSMRNTFKMTIYLACYCTEVLEREDAKRVSSEAFMGGKKPKKGKTSSNKSAEFNWVTKKEDMIKLLLHLSRLPVHRLWNPPVADEDLIDILVNICYRLLENPKINSTKGIKENVIELLGTMIKKHSLTLGCSLKLVQLLQLHEHLPQVVAEAVQIFVTKFDIRNLVSEIMREISNMDENEFAKDNASTKYLAVFLIELAERLPELTLNSISMMLCCLEQESYTLRNGVLGMFTEIILNLFCKTSLDEKDKINREKLLDYLEDHLHDVHAFVRSKVLQLWANLVEKNAIPLSRKHQIFRHAIERLNDKSSHVRKYAVQLVIVIMRSNPVTAKFSLTEIQQNYEDEKKKLQEMLETMTTHINNQLQALSLNDKGDEDNKLQDHNSCSSPSDETNEDVIRSVDDDRIVKQEKIVEYLKDTLEFTCLINEATQIIYCLLDSQQTTDVLEAANFFVESFTLGVMPALSGVRHMLLLIKSKETTIKEAVVEAYQKLYVPTIELSKRNQIKEIVKNLTSLVAGTTTGELASLEEMIGELVKSGRFPPPIIQTLWEFFIRKIQDVTLEESKMALLLLAMAAHVESDIVYSNIETLLNVGLNIESFDLSIAKIVCGALLKVFNRKGCQEKIIRFPNDHVLFSHLSNLLERSFKDPDTCFWVSFMEKAVSVIYNGADQPHTIMEEIIYHLVEYVYTNSDNNETCKVFLMTRLLSTIGHVALCQLIHLDVNVFSELKRRQQLQEENNLQDKLKRKSIGASASYTSKVSDNETADDELGLLGAIADDSEADYIRDICESTIVIGDNLLAFFAPVIIEVCSSPAKYSDCNLRNAAASALGKFMLVSSSFCESHLQLFFTIMEKSPEPMIRKNLVIILGDLAFRFPNLIDPWTSHLYDQLKDSSDDVRHTILIVLSNLILNDMIKVKGQISEIAKCIVDENEKISQFAKTFFTELGKKGNAVYNILPDVVSRLSDTEFGINEKDFQIIMKILFSFIHKDRQLESLVEKLCNRFKTLRIERQWRDLAFCLSLLSYSAKSLQKLHENFACYKDKLTEPYVFKTFLEILNNSKKSAKTEVKVLIEELEDLIQSTQNTDLDNSTVLANANKKLPSKTPIGKMKSRSVRKSRKENISDDDLVMSARRPARNKKKIQTALKFESDDSN